MKPHQDRDWTVPIWLSRVDTQPAERLMRYLITQGTAALAALLDHVPVEDLYGAIHRRIPPRDGAPYPLAEFDHHNACWPSATVELVVLRPRGSSYDLLVRRRGGQDVGYIGQEHAPGAYVLRKEHADEVIARIAGIEAGTIDQQLRFQYCGLMNDTFEERGHHLHHVFVVVDTKGVFQEGYRLRWVRLEEFMNPSSTTVNAVEHHWPIVDMALNVACGDVEPSVWIEYNPADFGAARA